MAEGNFKILSASAGTGKTYRLTKAYLLNLLRDNSLQNFRSLLAITFTNKAVAEMKQRILDNLFAFALVNGPTEKSPLFEEIAKKLNLGKDELIQRSKRILKTLLHNYAFFDVSTIDRFNHRLIRTFAKDLNISQNFGVELDIDYVLNKAVNQVLAKAGEDEQLTSTFVDFALEKIEAGKSWNITHDLNEIGKLIFQENHYEHLMALADKTPADFIQLKKNITAQIDNEAKKMQNAARASLRLIDDNGLDISDFTRSSFPKFMQQVVENSLKIDFNAGWKNNFEESLLYNKTLDQAKKDTIDALRHQFEQNFNLIKSGFHRASFLERCRKNIVPLALISEIQREIEVLKKEDSFLTINGFNELISRELKKQPIPYIYERLGERYHHYFIDEFQDTSVLQWENLIPLIGHALESTNERGQQGSLVLVGDVKQSIYRWRGGEAKQFTDLIQKKKNHFTIAPQIEQLTKNWRSYDEIIEFNNNFFSFIAPQINNSEYSKFYIDGNQQETNSKQGGVVKISFLPNDNKAELNPHCKKTLSNINEIIESGHPHGDICILVRDKKNEKLLAEYLIQNDVPIISAEGLLLANSNIVAFLVACAEFILNPLESEHAFSILAFLFKDSEKKHDSISKHLHSLPSYLRDEYDIDIDELRLKGMLDFFESLIAKFDLVSESGAYLIGFLDEVMEYEKSKAEGLYGFMDYWHLKKDKLSLPMPEDIDAVKIMTIHKSKGLEFPFVIFPFADTIINDSRKQSDIWVHVEPEEFSGFHELMVTNNKFLPHYSDSASKAYQEENEKSELDDINVLYVALTRAVHGLFIISTPVKENATQISYASLLSNFLHGKSYVQNASEEFVFGKLGPKTDNIPDQELQFIPYNKGKGSITDFELAKQSKVAHSEIDDNLRFGNLIHSLLAEIYNPEDIHPAISQHIELGLLEVEEIKTVEKLLKKVVQNENLKRFFAKDTISKNEVEILSDNGSIIRPDKLVFDSNNVTIIDYKTGERSEGHKSQLNQYEHILAKMGFETKEKILAYIDHEVTTLSF